MAFGLDPGKLGFKLGDVLVGLKSGTTDTPETITSDQGKLHTLGYAWNPSTLAYELPTVNDDGALVVYVANSGAAVAYALQMDDDGAGTTYVGEAAPGTGNATAAWRIKKIVSVGGAMSIKWADGGSSFTHVWDDRASLPYV